MNSITPSPARLFAGPLSSFGQTIDVEQLQALATYEYGQSHEILNAVENAVKAAVSSGTGIRSVAAKLAQLLEPEATNDCKQFVCRQLAIIGGPENVLAIAPLLLDAETADMAALRAGTHGQR